MDALTKWKRFVSEWWGENKKDVHERNDSHEHSTVTKEEAKRRLIEARGR